MTLSVYEAKEVQMLRNQLLFKEESLASQFKDRLALNIGERLGRPDMDFKIGDLVIHTTKPNGYEHLAVVAGYVPVEREPEIWEWGYSIIPYSQGNVSFEGRNRRYAAWPTSVRKATEEDIKLHISGDAIWKRFGKK